MEDTLPYILISAAIVLLAVVGGVALVRSRRGAPPQLPPGEVTIPTQGTTTAPPVQIPAPSTPLPTGPTLPGLEVPAPTAGRLVRLRARLARSQSAVGKALLAVLSRDGLTESDWDDVETLLLQADLGVGPTTELVDRLRTRVRVEGSSDPAPGARDARRGAARPGRPHDGPRPGRPARRAPRRDPGGRRERHRQDHHHRQARPGAGRRRLARGARRCRHLPRRRRRPAADLGRPGRRDRRPRAGGRRSGLRRVRRGASSGIEPRPTWC